MFVSGIIINVIALIFPWFSIIIYSKLLIAVFWSKTIKQKPELSLFYCRFVIDVVFSFEVLSNFVMHLLSLTSFVEFFISNRNFPLFIVWPLYLIMSMRAFLVFIIAVDRTFATYFPMTFFKYRKHVPTFFIMSFVMSYFALDASVVFVFCGEGINIQPGCVGMRCLLGTCYEQYWLTYEKATFFLKKVSSHLSPPGWDNLIQPNRLILIDTLIIIVFDLFPLVIYSMFPNADMYIGPINGVCKTLGFGIESYLVSKSLWCRVPVNNLNANRGMVAVQSAKVDTNQQQFQKF
ncbi:hypothetical protein CRE_08777 [Caenorhabditis remanei]|uniref:Serpentine Receptor, class BC (Class B-like) n=1 Tax=Caenorhabditis remanei TaxID=31234 RepID=E3LHG7_CAERE|nr:hypothetical protein CRE_08777 [Caenorhabditis remanei]